PPSTSVPSLSTGGDQIESRNLFLTELTFCSTPTTQRHQRWSPATLSALACSAFWIDRSVLSPSLTPAHGAVNGCVKCAISPTVRLIMRGALTASRKKTACFST